MIVKTMRWSNYPCSKHNQRYRTTKTSKMALSNCQPTTNTKRVSQEIHKSREIQIPKKRKWGGSAGGWAGQAGCLQLGGELQLLPTTHFIFRLQPTLPLDYNRLLSMSLVNSLVVAYKTLYLYTATHSILSSDNSR